MRELLSQKDKRLLNIIEYCIEHPLTTQSEISAATNISVRTISSSIQMINSLIEPCILESNNFGIKLLIPANLSSRYIMNIFMSNSFELSLIETIFKHPFYTINDIAKKYYLSENTVRRSLNNINRVLKKHGFKITTQLLKFSGDIEAMHTFFIVFFDEKYPFINESMNPNEFNALRYLIDRFDFLKEYINSDQDYVRIISWMYVKTLTFKYYNVSSSLSNTFKIVESKEAQEIFESAFNMPLTHELLSFWFSFATHGFYALSTPHALAMSEYNPQWKNLYRSINIFLEALIDKHQISLNNYNQVLLEIFNILRYPNKYSFILYSRDSSFVKSISNDLPLFYLSVLNALNDAFSDTLNEQDRLAVMYIVFTHWSHLFREVHSKKRTIHVGIYTDSNISHAKMIADVLKTHFLEGVETKIIQIIFKEDLLHKMNKLDLLITNVPALVHESCEVVCFSEYPSRSDWREIYAILNNLLFDSTKI